jgi:hypothetical protein
VAGGADRRRNAPYWSAVANSAPSSVKLTTRQTGSNNGGSRIGSSASSSSSASSRSRSTDGIVHGQYVNPATNVNKQQPAAKSGAARRAQRRPKRSFINDTTTRLKGVAYDLGKWKELPVKGVGAKIKYIFGRDGRPWSLTGVLGCLLLLAVVGVCIYFIAKAVRGKPRLYGGGSSAMTHVATAASHSPAVPPPAAVAGGAGTFDPLEAFADGAGGGGGGGISSNGLDGGYGGDPDLLSGEFPFIEFD